MNPIPFWKMSGSGNDFIIIDNRAGVVETVEVPRFVAMTCRRRMSVGADGLILIEPSRRVDFQWRFFNADGSVAEMCGNGARCAARFAHLNGIAPADMAFETLAGVITARVRGDQVRVGMSDPRDIVIQETIDLPDGRITLSHLNTGVPHAVIEVPDADAVDLGALGSAVRYHSRFAPAGTNVNLIAPVGEGPWAIRTYERGVEGETLACGTGVSAAALVLALRHDHPSPVTLATRGGSLLKVHFQRTGQDFSDVALEGDARVIYEGRLWPEGWRY
ncbi:diaminopimelate epimerase [Desulfatitalea alkaliphila]|uniref:Diaminopimelate epimerase n=1 Tax=Desulfatitalea alkaliphila TaxID=2929485 RepID=A0AA41R7H9_9BACT|nr:diaminopimelate epimerase [Desulfatitalea alkaliphila]MCJ8502570.1 diaminopimelate epimerase [Desulfatitalea alkaliphila]